MKKNLKDSFASSENESSPKPKKPKKRRNPPRVASIVGIGLGLIAALNLSIFLNNTLVKAEEKRALETFARAHTAELSQQIRDYLDDVKSTLVSYANKPTLLASMALGGDEEKLSTARETMTREINAVYAVNFFTPGQAALDPDNVPPIRFTELEMIQRAEDREPVLPEAANVDGKWIINMVTPMPPKRDDDVVGVVMLSLTFEDLKNIILKSGVSKGQVILKQQFGNARPLEIMSVGETANSDAVTYDIQNTFWRLSFKPSAVLSSTIVVDKTKPFAIIGISALVVVILFFYLGRFVGGVIQTRQEKQKETLSEVSSEEQARLDQSSIADVLDVTLEDSDAELLGLEDLDNTPAKKNRVKEAKEAEDVLDIADDPEVPRVVFRAYDIRGLADEQITVDFARLVGRALGSEAIDNGQDTLIVGRDARISSPNLSKSLVEGILSTGCHVLDIGEVPTPLLYFATSTSKQSQSGVMVTASHNPKNYNGFKVVMNGKSRSEEDLQAIRSRILQKDLYDGKGKYETHDIVKEYIDTIFSDVALAGDVSIVIDAANAIAGKVAPQLFEELGCNVTPLFCELDGNFPNHEPDPSVKENLKPLIEKVKETGADLGVAFDGDGDRVVVVTGQGRIFWPDRMLMIFAKDILSRNPGADVVFDVKSTKHLASSITEYGGRPIMWKTGHAPMKDKMLESGALLGGEYSGHIFIKDRWFGFDDGMYAAARLIEIITLQGQSLDEIYDEFPNTPCTPEIRIPVSEEEKFALIDKLKQSGDFNGARAILIDGIRLEFGTGWGLIRASNTSPNITLRCEADNEKALSQIKALLERELKKIKPKIQINWNQ